MSTQKTVLVVEDEDLLRSYLIFELVKMNLNVVEAKSGLEALSRVSEQQFDLIMTDLRMPDMDGKEFLMKMNQQERVAPPVIAVTGDAMGLEAHKDGFNIVAIVKKPFFPAEIRAVVEQALGQEKLSALA